MGKTFYLFFGALVCEIMIHDCDMVMQFSPNEETPLKSSSGFTGGVRCFRILRVRSRV